jgi:hypothetical protein
MWGNSDLGDMGRSLMDGFLGQMLLTDKKKKERERSMGRKSHFFLLCTAVICL